jgi:hypothetical protein
MLSPGVAAVPRSRDEYARIPGKRARAAYREATALASIAVLAAVPERRAIARTRRAGLH